MWPQGATMDDGTSLLSPSIQPLLLLLWLAVPPEGTLKALPRLLVNCSFTIPKTPPCNCCHDVTDFDGVRRHKGSLPREPETETEFQEISLSQCDPNTKDTFKFVTLP
uniref:Uncharacterized protein n=1 Tax=Rhipicephalus zambeziensis TaxID=60191 RepID=A0A224Y5U8_9ACAR